MLTVIRYIYYRVKELNADNFDGPKINSDNATFLSDIQESETMVSPSQIEAMLAASVQVRLV